jgi:hypothetical protein
MEEIDEEKRNCGMELHWQKEKAVMTTVMLTEDGAVRDFSSASDEMLQGVCVLTHELYMITSKELNDRFMKNLKKKGTTNGF